MRKVLIFSVILMLFGTLSAEEAVNAENAPENAAATESQNESKAEKQKIFYIQPAFGFGTGFSIFRPTISLDADILVAKLAKSDVYVGLDLDFRYIVLQQVIGPAPKVELPLQANTVFDFATPNVVLKSVGLWLSAGVDLIFYRGYYRRPDKNGEMDYFYDAHDSLRCFAAWGIGIDLLFEKNIVLKLGIDGFGGVYPDLTVTVGYRF